MRRPPKKILKLGGKNILNNTFQDFWIAFDMLFGQKKLLKNFPIYDKTSPPTYL